MGSLTFFGFSGLFEFLAAILLNVFLGEDLPSYLVLALGAALAVGNLAALIKPRPADVDPDAELEPGEEPVLERPPLGRSLVMIGLGTIAALWALASLLG